MRGVADLLRSAWVDRPRGSGRRSETELSVESFLWRATTWVSSEPKPPYECPRIIANIRANPAGSVGDCRRPAALGTLLEGALAFALDDAIDDRCEAIEIRLLADGSAMVTHQGPGFAPARAAAGLQRWPWLRRSPDGEVVLTQSLAAPVVTCALSHWCRLEVRFAHETWRQAFYRGEAECELHSVRVETLVPRTHVHFRPDPQVFGDRGFDIDDLNMRALGLLMELTGVELRIVDERHDIEPLVLLGTGPCCYLAAG